MNSSKRKANICFSCRQNENSCVDYNFILGGMKQNIARNIVNKNIDSKLTIFLQVNVNIDTTWSSECNS